MDESAHEEPTSTTSHNDIEKTYETIISERKSDSSPPPAPKMTTKRFMALLSLVWLITTSATPILFITATLCEAPFVLRS